MKHITTVIKGNIKKNKGVYISVFVLMLIVSVAMFSVLTYYIDTHKRDAEVMKENHFGDIFAAFRNDASLRMLDVNPDDLVRKIESCEDVKEVVQSTTVFANLYECAGTENTRNIFLLDGNDENIHYSQYDENGNKIDYEIKEGEISVPVSFESLYHCKIGDTVSFGKRGNTKQFKIASYLEDPFMGSSIMGIKTCLLNSKDFANIVEQHDRVIAKMTDDNEENEKLFEDEIFFKGRVLNIFKGENSNLNAVEFEKAINKVSGMSSFCWITLSQEQAVKYMMTLSNIYIAILMVFVLVLLVATMVVLGHNIGSSIELDYTNIGILKAVGMRNRAVRGTFIIGYLIMVVLAMIVAIPCSIPLVKFISKITRPTSGLYLSTVINLPVVFIVMAALIAIISLFIYVKTIRVGRITPLKAINGGIGNVHFSSFMKLPISKKFLNLSIAYRQFVSEKKQYLSVILVTAVLTLCMILISNLCSWANDKRTLLNMFNVTVYDMEASYKSDEIQHEAEKIISKYTSFESCRVYREYVLFDDMLTNVVVVDDTNLFKDLVKGRYCKYDNEIMITQFISEEFKLDIGDEVEVEKNGICAMYVISGIYDGANDQGLNFTMGLNAYKRIVDEGKIDKQFGAVQYRLEDASVYDDIFREIDAKYENEKDFMLCNVYEDDGFDTGSITVAISAFTILIYIIGAVFILVTVSIVCSKFIRREKKDYGIYKAVGVPSKKLRLQLALRFAVASFIGAVIGVIFNILFSKKIFNICFQAFGIYNYNAKPSIGIYVIPVIFMTVLFTLFTYILSRKVKKVDVRLLITE